MSLLGKILIVIQTILALLFLGVSATLYHHQNDWKQAYEETVDSNAKVVEIKETALKAEKSKNADLERDILTQRQVVESHRKEMKNLQGQLDDRIREAQQTRSDLDKLQADHSTVVATISEKDSQISEYLSRIGSLEDSLKTATGNQELAESQVARLLAQRTALEKDLTEVRIDYTKAKQSVLDYQLAMEELNRQNIPVDTILTNFPPAPPIRGLVTGVDTSLSPHNVVLSVGQQDGVKRGYTFTIYRGGKFIAKVVVMKLMADGAGCRVLFAANGETVAPGDQAATVLD
jgi:anion-transporting  ArsA/GET3 family ATPase